MATEKLLALLPKEYGARGAGAAPVVANMAEAFRAALAAAAPGDIILLSPGATSFGIFKNEYDRGDQFNALVQGLHFV